MSSQQKLETLDDVLAMWSKDAKIDRDDLDVASIDTAKLHSKYLAIMMKHNLRLRDITKKYDLEYKTKWMYFTGKLNSPENLKKYGFEEPYAYKLGTKDEISLILAADEKLQELEDLKYYHQKVVDSCENIMKSLSGRSYHITNVINWEKLRAGSG